MPPSSSSSVSFSSLLSSSSSPLLPLLLLLLLPPLSPRGATNAVAADAGCGSFRSGNDHFVLDAEDAVRDGAAPLDTARVRSMDECERACCRDPRCSLALLEPPGTGQTLRMCSLFNCIHRNRFVCRFVNQEGYQSSIRDAVFQRHLQGPGKQAPPIANAGRDVVVQPGVEVTLNGIESLALDDAHITDYRWSLLDGDHGVKMEETDLPDQVRLSNLQPGLYVLQLTVTDSRGHTGKANVSVTVLSPELTSRFCLAPLKVGPCRASFPRWCYDASSGTCTRFEFGGCHPNDNNYLSQDECESACSGVTALSERSVSLPSSEVCDVPCGPDELVCGSGCCVDRRLECDGVTHCGDGTDEEHCTQLNQTFSELLSIDVNHRRARCTEPPVTGPCRASHTRWYYDPLNQQCYRFTFGGCQGNDNNFEEEERCSETCQGVTEEHVFSRGLFDRFEKEEEGKSGSVALAVILSVAILALLAVLGYCFLKAHRKRSHRPVATGPAHVALSQEDTPVYNSTTKPV
ncbi:kunitz-type protease inhibitor 1-like [Mugil cephalus]|uniref:kunitz-type protease inhibitor 1-like n=1 Tax=Mugil cephalus TaxID=48193 RepID=UPI001FB579D1|nr:kunitz-type protease inhibitor 1-like [Mugil cephalus]